MLDGIDIIDAHHHLWNLSSAYPWLQGPVDPGRFTGDDSPIRTNYLPDDYSEDFRPLRLAGSVHVDAGAADSLGEVRWLHRLNASHGRPSAVIAGIDLLDPNASAMLGELAQFPLVRGVRQILNWHPNPRYTYVDRQDLMQDPRWLHTFARLEGLGLSFDLQIYPHQLREACTLADRHPGTTLVLNHTGMPIGSDMQSFATWREGMRALAQRPNTSVKISGLGMTHHSWTAEAIRPYVLETIEAFGPARSMFASNFPVDRLYSSLLELYSAFDQAVARFPEADRRALFGGTARAVYRLSCEEPEDSTPGLEGPAHAAHFLGNRKWTSEPP